MSRWSLALLPAKAEPVANPTRFVVRRGVRVAHLRFAEDRLGVLLDRGDGPELWDRARIVPRWVSRLRIEADGRPALTVTVCGQLDPEWAMRPGAVSLLWEGGSDYFGLDLAGGAALPRRSPWARRLRARRTERRRLLLAAASALPGNRTSCR